MRLRAARADYIDWLERTRDLSPHTLRAYQADLAAFERHVGHDAAAERIDVAALVGFVDAQRTAGLAPRSIRRRASGVRGFCKWLHAAGVTESDPWPHDGIAIGRHRSLPRALPGADLERLMAVLRAAARISNTHVGAPPLEHPHEATTLLGAALMVATGVRVSELVAITRGDIALSDRRLRVVGKGRRERHVYLTNDWIVALVSAYLSTRTALTIGHDRLLFNRRGRPLSAEAMRARLVTAAQRAGIRTRVTPHTLRHTAATQLIEAGVDIRYIQRLLGHASLTTTEIYTHVSDNALKRAISDADVLGRIAEAR